MSSFSSSTTQMAKNITIPSPFDASAAFEFAQGNFIQSDNDDHCHLAMGKFATLFGESSFFLPPFSAAIQFQKKINIQFTHYLIRSSLY